VILATIVWLWSLSLAERATFPLARPPLAYPAATSGSRRPRGRFAPVLPTAAVLASLILPAAAHALTSNAITAIARWKSMDKCAVQAQQAFPDFTAEANAKRDAKLKECLAGQNLPPRETIPPAQ
jgi:hypothetical protein